MASPPPCSSHHCPPLFGAAEREQGDGSTPSPSEMISAISQRCNHPDCRCPACCHSIHQLQCNGPGAVSGTHSALLMPIYKARPASRSIQLQPLSIPDVACRVWGSILNKRLLGATKDILADTMFGFRPGRCTADPLFFFRFCFAIYMLIHA